MTTAVKRYVSFIQLFCIIFHLRKVARAHAGAHDGYQRKVHRLPGYAAERAEAVCHAVGGYLHGAETAIMRSTIILPSWNIPFSRLLGSPMRKMRFIIFILNANFSLKDMYITFFLSVSSQSIAAIANTRAIRLAIAAPFAPSPRA